MSIASARRSAAPPTRRDEARALFRNAILEAAEAVFAERGFHLARIQDVAARARIAVGTVYNHFEQKEDLLRALLEERTEGFTAQLEVSPNDPPGFEAGLRARIGRILSYVESHRAFFVVAAEHGVVGAASTSATGLVAGKAARNVARVRAMFAAIVDDGIAAGALEPHDAPALVRFLGGVVRGFTIGALQQDPAATLAGDADLVVKLFLHGAARATPRPAKKSR